MTPVSPLMVCGMLLLISSAGWDRNVELYYIFSVFYGIGSVCNLPEPDYKGNLHDLVEGRKGRKSSHW